MSTARDPLNQALIELPDAGILYDPAYGSDWTLACFRPATWTGEGRRLQDAIGGRGAVVFVRADQGELAIRHFRRGGLVGTLFDDTYVWLGRERTRSFREWRLLRHLVHLGLPVPRPVAAAFQRQGWRYTADLVTARIPGAVPLSRAISRESLPAGVWEAIGRCVRRFHDAGVCHADLTGHNLLLDDAGRPWLLDFDRGRLRRHGRWRRFNLRRLRRSLDKIAREQPGIHFAESDWRRLMAGYAQTPA
jgi:3-deoxy-D-manno-octulosonic acid kinase